MGVWRWLCLLQVASACPASVPAPRGGSIPRILHQTWRDDKLPECLKQLQATWMEKNPTYQYRLWTDDDIERFVDDHYPHIKPHFQKLKLGVQKADLHRMMVLHAMGGIYVDLDMECLLPCDSLLQEQATYNTTDLLLVSSEPKEHCHYLFHKHRVLCNAFVASTPQHPILARYLSSACSLIARSGSLDRNSLGPQLLEMVSSAAGDKAVYSVPAPLIYPVVDVNNFNLPASTRAESCEMLLSGKFRKLGCPSAYMVHYWFHTDWNLKEARHMHMRLALLHMCGHTPYDVLRKKWAEMQSHHHHHRSLGSPDAGPAKKKLLRLNQHRPGGARPGLRRRRTTGHRRLERTRSSPTESVETAPSSEAESRRSKSTS